MGDDGLCVLISGLPDMSYSVALNERLRGVSRLLQYCDAWGESANMCGNKWISKLDGGYWEEILTPVVHSVGAALKFHLTKWL